MTGGSKIIGMWRDRDGEASLDAALQDGMTSAPNVEDLSLLEPQNAVYEQNFLSDDEVEAAEETAEQNHRTWLIPALVGLGIVVWSGIFLWAQRDIFVTPPALKEAVNLFATWCLPTLLIAVVYLIAARNSAREGRRFADVGLALRRESEALEDRLRIINGELSIAREFLASQSRELETLGIQSSQRLTGSAEQIREALAVSLADATSLDKVSNTAMSNMQQLREHLPVVITSAKDLTNQIGNTGRTAQTEVSQLINALIRMNEAGTNAHASFVQVGKTVEENQKALSNDAQVIINQFEAYLASAQSGADKIAETILQSGAQLATNAEQLQNKIHEAAAKSQSDLQTGSAALTKKLEADMNGLIGRLSELQGGSDQLGSTLHALIAELDETVIKTREHITELDSQSGEKTAKIAFAVTALETNTQHLIGQMEQGKQASDALISRAERLLVALDSTAREIDETLPAALDRFDARGSQSFALLQKLNAEGAAANAMATELVSIVEGSCNTVADTASQLEQLRTLGAAGHQANMTRYADLQAQIESLRALTDDLAENSSERLISALVRIRDTARQAAQHSKDALDESITQSAQKLSDRAEAALKSALDDRVSAMVPQLHTTIETTLEQTRQSMDQLATQISAHEKRAAAIEERLTSAMQIADSGSEDSFARLFAQLTENLNSSAIDVAKILSTEVGDSEWTTYLKGDRGIFTRRAVRLLDGREAKEVLAEYEHNSTFREHVNRYIHDFESMLRNVLATRDGSAVSVTLLSSDIGKLYVALAQAIERLRS